MLVPCRCPTERRKAGSGLQVGVRWNEPKLEVPPLAYESVRKDGEGRGLLFILYQSSTLGWLAGITTTTQRPPSIKQSTVGYVAVGSQLAPEKKRQPQRTPSHMLPFTKNSCTPPSPITSTGLIPTSSPLTSMTVVHREREVIRPKEQFSAPGSERWVHDDRWGRNAAKVNDKTPVRCPPPGGVRTGRVSWGITVFRKRHSDSSRSFLLLLLLLYRCPALSMRQAGRSRSCVDECMRVLMQQASVLSRSEQSIMPRSAGCSRSRRSSTNTARQSSRAVPSSSHAPYPAS